MTNGAGIVSGAAGPAQVYLGWCSVVRVALVAQVHRLLQRPAGNHLCFAHMNHVLRPRGLSHKGLEVSCGAPVMPASQSAAHAGSPRRGADSDKLAAAGNGDQPRVHESENTWTSKHSTRVSRELRRTAQRPNRDVGPNRAATGAKQAGSRCAPPGPLSRRGRRP